MTWVLQQIINEICESVLLLRLPQRTHILKGLKFENFLPLVSKSLKRLCFGSSFANSELTTDIQQFSKVRSMPLISEAERKERFH